MTNPRMTTLVEKSPTALPREAIPGPSPLPFLGSRGNLITFIRDPIGYMRMLYQNYGKIAAMVKKAKRGMIFAFGPQYNEQLLSNAALFRNAGVYYRGTKNPSNQRLAFGLLSMNDEQHKQHRRLIVPPFYHKAILGYRDPIARMTQEKINRWPLGGQLDIWDEIKRLTRLISSKIFFRLDDSSRAYQLSYAIDQWQELNISWAVRLYPIDFPGTPYHRMIRLAEKLEVQIREMISQRRKNPCLETSDILSLLIQARDEEGRSMSDDELIGQTNFLYATSYETTSNSTTWTLFLLSQHPNIMADLLDELTEVLHGEPPTLEQLNQLPLLERVIKESLRLLPPPVYSNRVCGQAVELGPYLIPKGTPLTFSFYITHHLPELYPHPEKFLPDRWLSINPSPYEYLPFGAGAHVCLGASFAMMTMKIVLSMILQRFRLSVIPGSKIDRGVLVTLGPKEGMPMLIEPQDREFKKSKTKVRGNIHEMVEID